MTTVQLLNEAQGADAVRFQNLLGAEFEAESTSICPLLTPSPSDPNMECTSPDPMAIPDPESASICPLLTPSPQPELFRHPLDPISGTFVWYSLLIERAKSPFRQSREKVLQNKFKLELSLFFNGTTLKFGIQLLNQRPLPLA